jgi:hypothetical protein
MWKEAVVAYSTSGGTEVDHREVRVANVPAEVRTMQLMNKLEDLPPDLLCSVRGTVGFCMYVIRKFLNMPIFRICHRLSLKWKWN